MPLIEGKVRERSQPIGFKGHGMAALSDNRYKLVNNPGVKRLKPDNGTAPISEWELYYLIKDPGETTNIIAQNEKRAARKRKLLEQWQASCEASNRGDDY